MKSTFILTPHYPSAASHQSLLFHDSSAFQTNDRRDSFRRTNPPILVESFRLASNPPSEAPRFSGGFHFKVPRLLKVPFFIFSTYFALILAASGIEDFQAHRKAHKSHVHTDTCQHANAKDSVGYFMPKLALKSHQHTPEPAQPNHVDMPTPYTDALIAPLTYSLKAMTGESYADEIKAAIAGGHGLIHLMPILLVILLPLMPFLKHSSDWHPSPEDMALSQKALIDQMTALGYDWKSAEQDLKKLQKRIQKDPEPALALLNKFMAALTAQEALIYPNKPAPPKFYPLFVKVAGQKVQIQKKRLTNKVAQEPLPSVETLFKALGIKLPERRHPGSVAPLY